MGKNKNKYLTYLAWFGFILAFLMLARYLYFHVEAELDADLASDLVFAEYVSEEKNPVPTQCHLDKDCFIVRNSYTADKHFVYLLYFYLITLLT